MKNQFHQMELSCRLKTLMIGCLQINIPLHGLLLYSMRTSLRKKQRIPVRITKNCHNSCGSTPIVQEKYFSMPAWLSSTVDSKLNLCSLFIKCKIS